MENSPRFVHNTEAKEGETSQMPFMEQNSDDASKGSSLAQPLRPPSNPRGLEAAPQSKAPDFPDGGLTAWLQVLGCFFLWFNSWYAFHPYTPFDHHKLNRKQGSYKRIRSLSNILSERSLTRPYAIANSMDRGRPSIYPYFLWGSHRPGL
jgi:hypothetical protein